MNADAYKRSADSLVRSLDEKVMKATMVVELLEREPMPSSYAERRIAELRILKAKEDVEYWQYLRDHAPAPTIEAVDKTEVNAADEQRLDYHWDTSSVEVMRN